jgi:hypothetical protein
MFMTTHIDTVAFQGIDCRPVDVQVQLADGPQTFMLSADRAEVEGAL